MQSIIAPASGAMRITDLSLQQAHRDAATRCMAATAYVCRRGLQQELPSVALGCLPRSNSRQLLGVLKAVQCPDRQLPKSVGTVSIGKDSNHRKPDDSPAPSSSSSSSSANHDGTAVRSKLVHHLRPLWHPLQPAVRAFNSLLSGIDPRVRGLVLLNIMTLLMGSNWVVIKSSNSAFDPVRPA